MPILLPNGRAISLIASYGRAKRTHFRDDVVVPIGKLTASPTDYIRDTTARLPPLFARTCAQRCPCVFAIQFRNKTGADLSGTNRFAFVSVRAIAETLAVHDVHHFQYPRDALGISLGQQRQMRDFSCGEEHG